MWQADDGKRAAAESPPTPIRDGSSPSSGACSITQEYAALASVAAAGEFVFRGKPIVDGDDTAARLVGERPAERIMRVEAAGDQPAAVKEDETRQAAGRRIERRIETDADSAAWSGQRPVDNRTDLDRLARNPISLRKASRLSPIVAKDGSAGPVTDSM